jgi:uncharacterized protein YecE (DUF72 family)
MKDSSIDRYKIPKKYQDLLRIGTCSWKYESWAGLIYQKGVNYAADAYLPEYARFFNSVEIDQWFWSLFPGGIRMPDAKSVQTYANSVPDDFIFTVKAPNSITLTHFYKQQPKSFAEFADKPNENFLSIKMLNLFLKTLEPMNAKLGPIMFQFEYLNRQKMSGVGEFLDRLDTFFKEAPEGYQYAIETRNKNYLTKDFFSFLKNHNLGFVFLDGYYMPPTSWIHDNFDTATCDFSIIRLHGPDRAGIEEATGGVWDKIVQPKDSGLESALNIVKANKMKKITTYVNVNNHYEGSAPITVQRFLEVLNKER